MKQPKGMDFFSNRYSFERGLVENLLLKACSAFHRNQFQKRKKYKNILEI